MLTLKLQYSGHLMWRADSLGKTLMPGKIEGRRRGRQRMRWLDGITDSMDMSWASSSRQWTGKRGVLRSMGHRESDTTERLNKHHRLRDCCARRMMVTARIPTSLSPKYIETRRAQIRPHRTSSINKETEHHKLQITCKWQNAHQNPRACPLAWQTYGNITQAPETLQKEKGPQDTDEAQTKSPTEEGSPTSNAGMTLGFCSLHHWLQIRTTVTKNASSNK